MAKAGRPTKYKGKYCKMLVKHMSTGLSFKAFGGVVSVCEDTLFEWLKVHKEFSESKKMGLVKCRLFWEQAGIDGMHQGKDFNSGTWIFNMKNRFNWKDKREESIAPDTLSAMFEKLEEKAKKGDKNASK